LKLLLGLAAIRLCFLEIMLQLFVF
jgi:hypothetical protein